MARYRDDGEVQIDNSTKVHFRNAFQQLIMIEALNVGTLLISDITEIPGIPQVGLQAFEQPCAVGVCLIVSVAAHPGKLAGKTFPSSKTRPPSS